ncbi:MAG: hypothetical protein MUE41_03050 [Gemmatimonadaceae bacterium]|jgi:hypothetical protein|nr:hypothetical protein [Gemmatimonadaceae bacterium]
MITVRAFVTVAMGLAFGHPVRDHAPAPAPATPLPTLCAIYTAAVAATGEDSGTVVVLDSTFAGIPRFALRAYTNLPQDSAMRAELYPDSVRRALGNVNERRAPLAACFAASPRVRLVASDSLVAFFRDGGGWTTFRARYPGARGFRAVSHPLVAADSASAVVYVMRASDWLAGGGSVLRLERDASGRWVVRAEMRLWVS